MNARQIYAALFDPRGPAREPFGEWAFFGDLQCFDPAKLRTIVSKVVTSSDAYIAVSRHNARLIPIEELCGIAKDFLSEGVVRISDINFRNFVELSTVGVARAWYKGV